MVFSSIPSYFDQSNWPQQQNHQLIGSSSGNPLLPPPPHAGPPPPLPPPHGVGAGSIRPGSMAERARMANIPMPETALKCPRCDSTNTKFCYFNNYSLSQPRHFCKTCRRYWTRGGALRSVPVGGGCRRNKRSKSSSSKSPASSDRQTNPTSTSAISTGTNSGGGGTASLLGLPPLRFMSPLGQVLTDSFTGDMAMNYSGITSPAVGTNEMSSFHGTTNFLGGGGGISSLLSGGGGIEQWRMMQQFPFFGGLDTSSSTAGVYQFQHGGESGFMGGGGEASHQVRPKLSSSMMSQIAPVKMEDNGGGGGGGGERQLLTGNEQQWNNGPTSWADLSSFSSSSTSNPL